MSGARKTRWNQETILVAWLAGCVSILSFLFFFRRGDLLLYGDTVAHINIARRVFDSRTPGLLQLGTVWLPLPHLLMLPFLLSKDWWQSGVGGSIPSMAAYVFGVIGIFRLVRGSLSHGADPTVDARAAAWMAALIYAANPNLVYLQSTAMTESLYLALFIWSVVYFAEFVAGNRSRPLVQCGACLAAACLTRYDGWFLAVVIGIGALAVVSREVEIFPTVLSAATSCALRSSRPPLRFLGRLQRHHLSQPARIRPRSLLRARHRTQDVAGGRGISSGLGRP